MTAERTPAKRATNAPFGPPTIVTAFVDWKAQMHNAGVQRGTSPQEGAQRTFKNTMLLVRTALTGESATEESARFRVSFRLYHGWYQGWEATENLKAAIQAVENADADMTALSNWRVSFSRTVEYGHTLLSALPARQHRRPPIHLPNTLRKQARARPPTEKMVDTALAADLLSWVRIQDKEWALVLAEDDDLIPPLYAAEAWGRGRGGRTLLVRKRGPNQYTKLDGILRQVR